MRLTISKAIFDQIIDALPHRKDLVDILVAAEFKYNKSITNKKRNATVKASKTRKETTKKKLMSSINLMIMENKDINLISIQKYSGLSNLTISKYEDFINSYKNEYNHKKQSVKNG